MASGLIPARIEIARGVFPLSSTALRSLSLNEFAIRGKLPAKNSCAVAENTPLTSAENEPHKRGMSTRIDQLLLVIDHFCAGRGVSEARASTLIFNGGGRIKQLRKGRDIGVLTCETSLQWLSDHWPEAAVWPATVPRPAPSVAADNPPAAAVPLREDAPALPAEVQ